MQFAKGITSGYVPLGGVGVSDKIRDVINGVPPAKRFMHAYTYSGHPTCCAVALRNIKILRDENLVARAAELGKRFGARLGALAALDRVGHVRSLGLIGAVEVVADKTTKALHPPEAQMTQRLTDELLARGVYTRIVLDCICIAPPLVITEAELDKLVDTIGDTVATLTGPRVLGS
jgi:adenosylmethionine-8-amino-7-oxononanoate aminotransferase